MLGFLEQEEEDKKVTYFKSALVIETSTKIDWCELMAGTAKLMRETWPEIAEEYISNYCTEVEVVNPFDNSKHVLSMNEPKKEVKTDDIDYGGWYE